MFLLHWVIHQSKRKCIFWFRNKIASTFFGFKVLLCFWVARPALENSLSEGVEVAGTQRICRATLANLGKRCLLTLHHCKGLVSREGLFSARLLLVVLVFLHSSVKDCPYLWFALVHQWLASTTLHIVLLCTSKETRAASEATLSQAFV